MDGRHRDRDIVVAPTIIATNFDGKAASFFEEMDPSGTFEFPPAHEPWKEEHFNWKGPVPDRYSASVWRKFLFMHITESALDSRTVLELKEKEFLSVDDIEAFLAAKRVARS